MAYMPGGEMKPQPQTGQQVMQGIQPPAAPAPPKNYVQPQQGAQQGAPADPFLNFLMGQLGIAGFGQQQQPQPRGRNDWWGQGQQQAAPADPYQQLLGQLGGIDPLLGALLGGFQPQPQPQQQGNLLSQILGGY